MKKQVKGKMIACKCGKLILKKNQPTSYMFTCDCGRDIRVKPVKPILIKELM